MPLYGCRCYFSTDICKKSNYISDIYDRNILRTDVLKLLQDILHIIRIVTFLKTVLFRTTCVKYFICKVVTMSDGFGHVRTECRKDIKNNIVTMSGLFW